MRAAVFLAPGFEEVEAVTPIDFLRRAGIDVDVLGVGATAVRGARGVTISADGAAEGVSDLYDAIVFPGGMPGAANLAASGEIGRLIVSHFEAGKLVAAICASPAVVLSPSGILSGKRATCYPGFEDRLSSDTRFTEARVAVDGNLITSRGPGTAAEFAIEVIRYLAGDEAAREVHRQTLQRD